MSKNGIRIFIAILLVGCQQPSQIDNGIRDKLIRSIVMANSDFTCYACKSADDSRYEEAVSQATTIIRQEADDSLGLQMSLHHFSNLAGNIPNVIIYVNISPNLEYAFILNDEHKYLDQTFLITDQDLKRRLDLGYQLETQLNIIAARLGIISVGRDERKMQRFIELFFNKLLGCELLEVSTATMLEQEMNRTLQFVDENAYDSCLSKYRNNFANIRREINGNSASYFLTHIGVNSLWRIKVDTLDNRLTIKTSLANYQCYTSFGL